MSKKDILKDFLSSKDVADDVKKERFSIAYDIYKNLPLILHDVKMKFLTKCSNEIERGYLNNNKDWHIEKSSRRNSYKIYIYKERWLFNKGKPQNGFTLLLDMNEEAGGYLALARDARAKANDSAILQFFPKDDYKKGDYCLAYQYMNDCSFFDEKYLQDIFDEKSKKFTERLDKMTNAFGKLFALVQDKSLETLIDNAIAT